MWRKRCNKYGLWRKGGLVVGDNWILFGVSIIILEFVGKLLEARSIGMQSKVDPYQDDGTTRWSKEESRYEVSLSPSWRRSNLEDEIHLKGVEL